MSNNGNRAVAWGYFLTMQVKVTVGVLVVEGTEHCHVGFKYCISQTIRHTFFPEKCDLDSTCVLYAEGKYHISRTIRRTFS